MPIILLPLPDILFLLIPVYDKYIKCLKRCLYQCCLCLIRPYPFQLWVAPRNKWYDKLFSYIKKPSSVPGFIFKEEEKGENDKNDKENREYAMFLYPDSLVFHWIIFFIFIILIPSILRGFVYYDIYDIICCFIFISSYFLIYVIFRRPILDDVLGKWPDTEDQEKYFKSVPSRITFFSEQHYKEYFSSNKDHSCSLCSCFRNFYIIFRCCIEKVYLCRPSVLLKTTSYFHRPIFFNPEGSFQEGMLRTGIASFFSKKEKISNILLFIFYCLPHIWVSYLYLCCKLICIFIKDNPACNQDETRYLIIQIIIWLLVSAVSLVTLSFFVKKYILDEESHERLFSFSPPRIAAMAKEKLHINKESIRFLHPKISIPIISALVFTGYLAVLNLTLQYAKPTDLYGNSECIQEKFPQSIIK